MSSSPAGVIALAGNPNVGKSTVFNALTGLHQHTGNWTGKTVSAAVGSFDCGGKTYTLTDTPGTYSLFAHSAEEEVARDFLCFGNADAVIAVCDATCLERNLILVLQILEITSNVVVCLNLTDEAERKNIKIDTKELSRLLGVPVIPAAASSGKGLAELKDTVCRLISENTKPRGTKIIYPPHIEDKIRSLESEIRSALQGQATGIRRAAVAFLGGDTEFFSRFEEASGISIEKSKYFSVSDADSLTAAAVLTAETICQSSVCFDENTYCLRDRRIDRILTGKPTGYPIMILLLAVVLWITVSGANYPSAVLSFVFEKLKIYLFAACYRAGFAEILTDMLINGIYTTLTSVISVMLPPMAIFFPLFTFLEDLGYLPRVAFNLDKPLKKCNACGKQALTMCMGFGCNAVGISGCRIIDSPRERLIAVLTNNFIPCNGRFPMIIAVASVFFGNSVISAAVVCIAVIVGIIMTFIVSRLLSATLLRGKASSFTLELPPYRKPAVGKIIVRSLIDRTAFVLARAAAVAAPAGLVIWLMTHITVGNASLLNICSNFLDPLGRMMGLNGVILFSFVLGIPANETVMPLILMAYTGNMTGGDVGNILTANGWTIITAVNTIIFAVMHWPCATSLWTVKKETGSLKWTAAAFLIPTIAGMAVCTATAGIMRIFIG